MIISFDVGLRNLAFCVLDYDGAPKIREWGVIDVMAEGSGHGNTSCFKCKKPGCWKLQEKYACTKHKGQTFTKTLLMKKTLDQLKKEAESLKLNLLPKKKKPRRWIILTLFCFCLETMYKIM